MTDNPESNNALNEREAAMEALPSRPAGQAKRGRPQDSRSWLSNALWIGGVGSLLLGVWYLDEVKENKKAAKEAEVVLPDPPAEGTTAVAPLRAGHTAASRLETVGELPAPKRNLALADSSMPDAQYSGDSAAQDQAASQAAREAQQKAQLLRETRLRSAIAIFPEGDKLDLPAGASTEGNASYGQGDFPPMPPFYAQGQPPSVIPAAQESVITDDTSRSNRPAKMQTGGFPANASVRKLLNLEFTALQGKMIDAVLETPIQSDNCGSVRAMVTSPLYAEKGDRQLLPWGTRLIGTCNAAIRAGQVRIYIVWLRAVTPQGIDAMIHSDGADALGRAGIPAHVDNHFWRIWSTSAALSIIGAGAATSGRNNESRGAAHYSAQVQSSFANTAQQTLSNNLNIPPTLSVNQGMRIKVFLQLDLDLSNVLQDSGPP
ncbi:TrbI/VirB10 family protein [Chitinimonas sp. BJB300]|uniref:TrbI/VirB10 family protein n=1 Tax=Chitinimonas sp. BJB300 TaxID=1559339 RepID=UPI001303F8CF|nr:TrbI/VirB10 family protein [Chitinimonas sp. BJB300]